jgi:hypothetical protein
MVSTPRRNALTKAGLQIPTPELVNVLVDTGASGTCIDPSHIAKLGISPSGIIDVHTPSTAGVAAQCNQFDVDIAVILDNGQYHFVNTLPVIESSLASQGIDGLLGRDVLSQGILIFNGAAKTFTLSF